jgi:hypothetical protein
MINFKTVKKKTVAFFSSEYFFLGLIFSFFLYIGYFSYTFIRERQDTKAFALFHDLLSRYDGALKSSSTVPLEELSVDIELAIKKIGFFSTLKNQFLLLQVAVLFLLERGEEARDIFDSLKKDRVAASNEFAVPYGLCHAMYLATSQNQGDANEGIAQLKKYANKKNEYQDLAIFYYGYFALKNISLQEADNIWEPLFSNPLFLQSPYKKLVESARNCDY